MKGLIKSKLKLSLWNFFKKCMKYFGYSVVINTLPTDNPEENNLNIGCSGYTIEGFKSLDIYTPNYYKNKEEFLKKRIEYDIRCDDIPFPNNSVDNIYISHVIEHIEDEYVENFFYESFRVLKKERVLRIACPDVEFLYNVSQFKNEYWNWRKSTISNTAQYKTNWNKLKTYDYLIREVATPRMRYYKDNIKDKVIEIEELEELSYKDFCQRMKKDLSFRANFSGNHINNWDFNRILKLGKKIGFSHIIKSKHQGSVSEKMQSASFDRTAPWMSLYVDLVK